MSHTERKPVALVTGARQGIGRAIALALAERGFDIVVADLHDDARARTTLGEIRALGASASFIQADIANLEAHARLVDAAWSCHGGIDCLVDNAGVAARPLRDVLEITPADFDFNFGVNIRGTFFLTQAVANRMLADKANTRYRSIIVITSMAAHYASVHRSQYSMSKAALAMMVKVLAVRLASSGIFVHDIRPGLIRTDMTGSLDTGPQDARIASGEVPMRRWGEASDVGRLAATLASGELPYMTGEPFVIDGGLRANSP